MPNDSQTDGVTDAVQEAIRQQYSVLKAQKTALAETNNELKRREEELHVAHIELDISLKTLQKLCTHPNRVVKNDHYYYTTTTDCPDCGYRVLKFDTKE